MKRRWIAALPLLLLAIFLGDKGHVLAESGAYTLLRGITTTDGVVTTQVGDYQLQATIGQPIVQSTTAGNIGMEAGYWYRGGAVTTTPPGLKRQYLPLVIR